MSARPQWALALRKEPDGASVEIDILDAIGEWSGPNGVTARNLVSELRASGDVKNIRVRMNSGGGEVMEGLAIYNVLREHGAKVEVEVIGVAASMASVIAMAADVITMAPSAFMMVHNPWSIVAGDGDDLRDAAAFLDKLRDSLAGIYSVRTKRPKEEIAALMNAETWLTADEAVEQGFADRVAPPKKADRAAQAMAFASLVDFTNVPEALRSAIAAQAAPPPAPIPPPADGPAANNDPPPPIQKERHMAENKTPDPTNSVSVAIALGLPVGSTESDTRAAAVGLRDFELQVMTVTGAASRAEAVGMVRGMASAAIELKDAREELLAVKAERDAQKFESIVKGAVADLKLTPAEEKVERDLFAKAIEDGRSEDVIAELVGRLKVKAVDHRRRSDKKPGEGVGSGGAALVWNGKAYRDLPYAQRAKLAKENPELYRLMKDDHDAQSAA